MIPVTTADLMGMYICYINEKLHTVLNLHLLCKPSQTKLVIYFLFQFIFIARDFDSVSLTRWSLIIA